MFSLMLVPALGGRAHELLTSYRDFKYQNTPLGFAWTLDSTRIMIATHEHAVSTAKLLLVDIRTRSSEELAIFDPPADRIYMPAISPDGRRVVFFAVTHDENGFWLQDLGPNLEPVGAPQKLDFGPPKPTVFYSDRIAWSQDNRHFFAGFRSEGLWKVPVDNPSGFRRIDGIPGNVASLAASSRSGRLTYEDRRLDSTDFLRIRFDREGGTAGMPEELITSSRVDFNPMLSPDGTRIALSSNRTGSFEILVCNAEGEGCYVATSGEHDRVGSPRWSPDGEKIVFDMRLNQNGDIYEIPATGGEPRQITVDPGFDAVPCYSPDGRWIYFASDRRDGFQVWRVPSSGGAPEQVTKDGGFSPFISSDGKTLFYLKENTQAGTPLLAMPVEGGPAAEIISAVCRRGFALTRNGIYYVPWPEEDAPTELHYLDLETGRSRRLTEIPFRLAFQLSTIPDGLFVLFSRGVPRASDLMLVEPLE